MARQYPTYIHHIETKATSQGEFIIRTVAPKFIVKVNRSGEKFHFDFLEIWDKVDEKELKEISDNLYNWYKNRILKNPV
jgi:hypothetical protein